jgi:hypothetical protein
MPTLQFSAREWAQWVSTLGPKLNEAMQHGLLDGAQRCVPVMHRSTDQAPPASARGGVGARNQGDYRRAWQAAPHPEGAVLFNPSPYAGVIEFGRRIGKFPPLDAIARWAQRKLRVARVISRGKRKGTATTRAMTEKEARSAAFPIARAIARRGLRARFVMTSRLDEMASLVYDSITHAIDVVLERK